LQKESPLNINQVQEIATKISQLDFQPALIETKSRFGRKIKPTQRAMESRHQYYQQFKL
jgi:hypothetical protein